MSHVRPPLCSVLCILLTGACAGDDGGEVDETEASTSDGGSSSSSSSSGAETPEADESTGQTAPQCGNGIVEDDEACDEGESNGSIGSCATDCSGIVTGCGDGQVQAGEVCDDANDVDGDGCNTDCRASGTILWERTLTGAGTLHGVDIGEDDDIYVAGSSSLGPIERGWSAKIADSDGSTAWEVATNGAAFESATVLDGDRIAFGGRLVDAGMVLTTDSTGTELEAWTTGDAAFTAVVELPDGDYLTKRGDRAARFDDRLALEHWDAYTGPGLTHLDGEDFAVAAVGAVWNGAGFRVLQLDGTVASPTTFPMPPQVQQARSRAVARASNGDVVVAGFVTGTEAREVFAARSSLDGRLEWHHGPGNLSQQDRTGRCVTVDGDDSVIVGGASDLLGSVRPLVMKLAADGTVLWIQDIELEASDGEVWDCATNSANEIVVVGQAEGQRWMAKLAP